MTKLTESRELRLQANKKNQLYGALFLYNIGSIQFQ